MKTHNCYWCVNKYGLVIDNAYFTDIEVFRKACADLRKDNKEFTIKSGKINIVESEMDYFSIKY